MPLEVFLDVPPGNNPLAHSVYYEASSIDFDRRFWVGPGGFAIANNPNDDTALGTSGAGPCQIIIVHKGRGRGALGHYFAHPNPNQIVRGVCQMVGLLGVGPIVAVVFAAGEVGVGNTQQEYQLTIVGRVRALCPGARVEWPTGPRNGAGHWGAGYYLPFAEEIGLFESQPGGFEGAGGIANGISLHNYL